jgi:hypothetical protein
MLVALVAQLRFAASIALGLDFDVRSLERLVDALAATRREFGAFAPGGADVLDGPYLDENTRRELHLRRFRTQAERAARETAYYASLFETIGIAEGRFSFADTSRVPLTTKAALRADPDAFVRRTARPTYHCVTTGSTGQPTSVLFSADELRSFVALVGGLLALGAPSAVQFALEPIVRTWTTRGLLVALVAALELAVLVSSGPSSSGYFAINNAVLIVGAVGVANLWAHSGLKARDAAILGAGLAAYDVIATSHLTPMSDLFGRLSQQPFAPIVGWTSGQDGRWVAIGLGDVLVATVYPPVMRRAYGRVGGRLDRARLRAAPDRGRPGPQRRWRDPSLPGDGGARPSYGAAVRLLEPPRRRADDSAVRRGRATFCVVKGEPT